MPKQRTRRGETFWRERIAEFAAGSLTVEQFCRQQDLAVASFYAWKRKLQQTAAPGGSEPQHAMLVPVTIIPEHAADTASLKAAEQVAAGTQAAPQAAGPSLTIRLPGGVVIDIFAEPQR